jgi:glutathione synthase/RimK-type ligase-like ATP-grasp enzyme
MQEIFKKNDIQLVRASINKYNKTKNEFTEYNYYDTNGIIKTIKSPYTPDIIRNRKGSCTTYKYALLKSFTIIPSERIAALANDKYETYMFLKKYQPKTFLLGSILKNTSIQEKHT